MINLITERPTLLSKFLDRLSNLLSNVQFQAFLTYVSGPLMQHKRTSIDSIANLAPAMKYQNPQYFLSESKIDYETINLRRIEVREKAKPTRTTTSGILAIDYRGANPQFASPENKLVNSNVVVLSSYCDPERDT